MNNSSESENKPVQCPHCHGENVRFGSVYQHGFLPSNRSIWRGGYLAKGFVCLDCGFLGHYLSAADLQDIKDKDAR